ncbi:MAG: 2-oxo-hepta-3-ene-1,7-dioic acid hydratase [Candidatus Binatus sp.]|uniref:2-oxo-hept-4-ene-1,7-dioate hydratase n=1 Tax=Candidatus Binatus sp. TaxID=2811406 RepID=UPI002727002A|nr:2-oxo-hepta-3-ene-1,7-dioic acid hydratase [Candidatus Binatus sp.]MDO8432447.1 2-oxo-hepta-3-ene-1,7-dioic acid hydratase [Candidatus Binatus sp.]
MDAAIISRIASQLHEAEKNRTVIRFLSAQYPEMTIGDSYAIQRAWIDIKLKEGRRIIGHKIGLTSRAMQSTANINEPDYGVLLDDMLYHDGSQIPANRFITPMLENELAFVLGKPLRGPNCSIFDVLGATEYVIPALEIVGLRTMRDDPQTKAPRRVVDTIADNAANAALVIGGRPIRPLDVDLRWVGALCYRNGVLEESGIAAAVLNHPANGIAWLANKLALHDQGLEAGQIVLAGSFTRVVPARAGDTFHVDYGPLGSISCRFVGDG